MPHGRKKIKNKINATWRFWLSRLSTNQGGGITWNLYIAGGEFQKNILQGVLQKSCILLV
jgi:hypothetical protein